MKELIGTISAHPVRLSIANVPTILCDLLKQAFDSVEGISLVGPQNDLEYLLYEAPVGSIDVILIGSSKGSDSTDGVEALRICSDRHKAAAMVALTQDPRQNEVVSLFRAGARGILSTANMDFESLCKCVCCIHDGQIWASNEYISHLIKYLLEPSSVNVKDSLGRSILTTREQQVLHLLADGLSNSGLASKLKLSEHTVKNHLFRIYDKLGVSNRMEAVLYALASRGTAAVPQDLTAPVRPAQREKLRLVKIG